MNKNLLKILFFINAILPFSQNISALTFGIFDTNQGDCHQGLVEVLQSLPFKETLSFNVLPAEKILNGSPRAPEEVAYKIITNADVAIMFIGRDFLQADKKNYEKEQIINFIRSLFADDKIKIICFALPAGLELGPDQDPTQAIAFDWIDQCFGHYSIYAERKSAIKSGLLEFLKGRKPVPFKTINSSKSFGDQVALDEFCASCFCVFETGSKKVAFTSANLLSLYELGQGRGLCPILKDSQQRLFGQLNSILSQLAYVGLNPETTCQEIQSILSEPVYATHPVVSSGPVSKTPARRVGWITVAHDSAGIPTANADRDGNPVFDQADTRKIYRQQLAKACGFLDEVRVSLAPNAIMPGRRMEKMREAILDGLALFAQELEQQKLRDQSFVIPEFNLELLVELNLKMGRRFRDHETGLYGQEFLNLPKLTSKEFWASQVLEPLAWFDQEWKTRPESKIFPLSRVTLNIRFFPSDVGSGEGQIKPSQYASSWSPNVMCDLPIVSSKYIEHYSKKCDIARFVGAWLRLGCNEISKGRFGFGFCLDYFEQGPLMHFFSGFAPLTSGFAWQDASPVRFTVKIPRPDLLKESWGWRQYGINGQIATVFQLCHACPDGSGKIVFERLARGSDGVVEFHRFSELPLVKVIHHADGANRWVDPADCVPGVEGRTFDDILGCVSSLS